jgi:hypothetical protein
MKGKNCLHIKLFDNFRGMVFSFAHWKAFKMQEKDNMKNKT